MQFEPIYVINAGFNERIIFSDWDAEAHTLSITYTKGWSVADMQEHVVRVTMGVERAVDRHVLRNDGSELAIHMKSGNQGIGIALNRLVARTITELVCISADLDQIDVEEAVRVARAQSGQCDERGAACGGWPVGQ